jgi:coenzyme F420-reducing hydrogenase delta subunit
MARVREFIEAPDRRNGQIVAICCDEGPGAFAHDIATAGGVVFPVSCAGNLHTSTIELLLRSGAGGVLVLTCPPRDCQHREGPRWISERVYHGREAELQDRVDRARVRIANANAYERLRAIEAFRAFATDIGRLDAVVAGSLEEIELECDPPPVRRKR